MSPADESMLAQGTVDFRNEERLAWNGRTTLVDYDPTRDKTYRRAKLAGDVVAWLDWMALGGTSPRTLGTYERVLARLCILYPTKTLDELQMLLGHASIATTADIYTHTDVDDVARHMALIEADE